MMAFFTLQLKKDDKKLIEIAKKEFISHHPEWEIYQVSNRKIVFESLRYYIMTGKYKDMIPQEDNHDK